MLGLWKTDRGSLFSHKNGLSKEQVEFFKTLKEGDRIALFPNNVKFGPNSPDFSLRKWVTDEEFRSKSTSK